MLRKSRNLTLLLYRINSNFYFSNLFPIVLSFDNHVAFGFPGGDAIAAQIAILDARRAALFDTDGDFSVAIDVAVANGGDACAVNRHACVRVVINITAFE